MADLKFYDVIERPVIATKAAVKAIEEVYA